MFSGFSSALCPTSEPGFLHWASNQPSFFLHHHEAGQHPLVFSPQEPLSSNSASDTTSNASHALQNSPTPDQAERSRYGSDEPEKNNSKTLSSGSDGEERKRRRMLSNRDSARRSRLRKQQHLTDLRTRLSRLKIGNRELMNRLRFSLHQTEFLNRQNECLRSETVVLRQRLWDIHIRQVLIARNLQQHLNSGPICMAMH